MSCNSEFTMNKYKNTKNNNLKIKKQTKRVASVLILLILSVILIAIILYKADKLPYIGKSHQPNYAPAEEAQTTSTTPTAQADFTNGDDRQPGNTDKENQGSAVVSDNNGEISENVDKSQPVSSNTGEITVYSPVANTVITSGQSISGSSTLPRVTYRLVDDVTGMIAMGSLNVVNGKFSGTITFSTSAKSGKIDIFATREDQSEYSKVEIPINFR